MSLVTKVSDLATRVGTEFKAVRSTIGSLSSLSTTDKSSVVAAINEVLTSAGPAINDTTASTTSVYSSSKVASEISGAITTAEGYADGLAGNYDAAGAAASAETAAKSYADGLATNYDAAGAATSALNSAKSYTDSLAANYDPAGAAATAQSNAQSYADAAVAAIVDAAPGTLDTLNELAAALGDDANFAATTSTALGNRVRVDAAQSFNSTEQGTARSNIGAAASSDLGDPATNFVTVFEAALV